MTALAPFDVATTDATTDVESDDDEEISDSPINVPIYALEDVPMYSLELVLTSSISGYVVSA